MNRVLFGLLLLSLSASQAIAGAPFDYARDAVRSLAAVKDATSGTPNIATMEPTEGLRALMRACVLQRTAIEAEGRRLEPYAASTDKKIAESAGLIIQAYALIAANLTAAVANMESLLNNPNRVLSEPGTASRENYELEARSQQAWTLLIKATATIAFALYDEQRLGPDGKLQRLRITKTEREALKAELVKGYGRAVTRGSTKDSRQNMVPGEMLWGFVTNPKWLDADAK